MKTSAAFATLALITGALTFPAFGTPPASERIVYDFNHLPRGSSPFAGLIYVGGLLYGTTNSGGIGAAKQGGYGTVFSINPRTGIEKVVYSFRQGKDGEYPQAKVLYFSGTFYGTTKLGGDNRAGTIFAVNRADGTETVLHAFGASADDGTRPTEGVAEVNGTLYGVTPSGGANGYGTIYSFDLATQTYTTLYSFKGRKEADGNMPNGELVSVGNTLYGTTAYGGKACAANGAGCGTIFSFDIRAGTEKPIYIFQGGHDGDWPTTGLVYGVGNLFGTTNDGPGCTNNLHGFGCGVVFSLDLSSGVEKVLYSFTGGADGATPASSLIRVNGMLYGTTTTGGQPGSPDLCSDSGCGVVFMVDPEARTEQVLHSFTNAPDGASPYAGLFYVRGVLYGTTYFGGAGCGFGDVPCGTVFSVTP